MADNEKQECIMKPTSIRRQNLKASILFLAILSSVPTAYADTAKSNTLGRIFFTPQQRSQLDYSYARNAPVHGDSSPFITVNGIVQKQGGPRTVWINGSSQAADNYVERNPTTQTVAIPGKAQAIKIKVGDKVLLDQPPAATRQDANTD
jgi:hypothetical protein